MTQNINFHFNNVVIVCGPVIIKDNKVLLNKHGESNLWKFPGGDITQASDDLETWAQKKVKEEMDLAVEIIKALKPMVIWKNDEVILLFHYLAELKSETIKPAAYIREYGWHDINNLPSDCSPNIKPIIEEVINSK
ncbi:MAG: NUDIX domain-containing protein [Patescibacteria group bacterium]